MTVYRVQHKETKRGPYSGGSPKSTKLLNILDSHSDGSEHPTMYQEMGLMFVVPYSHRHGFTSLEKLCNWFTMEAIELLYKDDFHVCVYEVQVDKIVEAEKQCVFNPPEQYQSLDMWTLLELATNP